jgi:hypothetical protein
MSCCSAVPISTIPPVGQGVGPLVYANGNQMARLNPPLNPSFVVYDGSVTRWGDGSVNSPVLLPNLQQVPNSGVNYFIGINAGGQLVETTLPSVSTSGSYNDLTDKPNLASGRTIYVDAVVGTDSRGANSNYSFSVPFATIDAAVAASTSVDLIYVKAGSHTIASTISLNGKGNLFFELGANVTVAINVVAFSLTADESHGIFGYGVFTCSGTGGFWTQSGGNPNTQVVNIECLNITNNIGAGIVFAVGTGNVVINITAIVAPASTIVSETGTSGGFFYRVYQTVCGKLLDMTQANSRMQFTADCWTVSVAGTEGLSIVGGVTSFIFQNLVGAGNPLTKLVVFKFANGDATLNSHVFRSGRLIANSANPCITFNATTATNKSLRLMGDVQLATSATNCIVSANPRQVVVSSANSNVVSDANTSIVGGTLLVSPFFA